MKQKAILFLPYLAPYRIDVLNELGEFYDLTVIFQFNNAPEQKFDQKLLRAKLKVPFVIFDKGLNIGTRQIRIGVYKLLKRYKPSVVFSNEYGMTSVFLSFYKKISLFDYILVGTTSDNLIMADEAKWFRRISRRFVLSSANGVVVYSNNVKKWYQKKFPKLRVELCPNIQNPDNLLYYRNESLLFSKSLMSQYDLQKSKLILYVGRLDKVKGLDLLLYSFMKVKRTDYKLVIVGDGPQKNELRTLATVLNISENVVFPGRFDGVELYGWYLAANFFVLPSLYEPFGAVVNEALVFGLPVLASKYIGALDFISEGQNGYIFDPTNEKDFMERLSFAMNKYSNRISSNNLMIHSFEDSVLSYLKVIKL